jgi:hypothetical protein
VPGGPGPRLNHWHLDVGFSTHRLAWKALTPHAECMENTDIEFIELAAPEYWYTYAQELAETADQIYRTSKQEWVAYLHRNDDGSVRTARRPVVSRSVMLLYGLSIENLIKGILISENPSFLEGGKLNKHLIGHDLLKLAGRMRSVNIESADYDLLALLSDVVPYLGRYPVPKSAQDLKPEKYITEDVFSACKGLFDRLVMQLYRLNFQGIDGPNGVRFANLRLTHLDAKADFINDQCPETLQDILREFKEAEDKGAN